MMENTKSMLIHAWIAVLVQVLAQQVPSIPNKVLIYSIAVGVGAFLALAANYYKRTSCLRCLLFLFVENRKRILPHKRTDFVTFALRRSDCSLAGSFLSETVLSGRTERLTQGNKTVLLCGKIPFLFSSVCQIPFRLFFRKNRLFFLKIPSLETAISCLAFWVLRMASSSFL